MQVQNIRQQIIRIMRHVFPIFLTGLCASHTRLVTKTGPWQTPPTEDWIRYKIDLKITVFATVMFFTNIHDLLIHFQREIKEKLHFYHVKPKPRSATSLFEPPAPKSPSPFLWSTSSYLLFNTAENPYGNLNAYIDPFDARSKTKKSANNSENKFETGDRQGLQDAPSSLSNLRGLDDPFNENLYIPVRKHKCWRKQCTYCKI